ncbi:MAG: nitroreductase family protein [Anaerolineales bacterium]|nr:nitroreductase family protein [Anaerolineales bacterium]
MNFNQPVSDLIRKRYSCRTYQDVPIQESDLSHLLDFLKSCTTGPLGSQIRFKIVAAKENDSKSLKGLGTYGFIKNPTGFVLGKSLDTPGSLEDFGYLMEAILIKATELEIGSCWLGGTFTKSRFARILDLQNGEIIPSVASIGYPADQTAFMDRVSRLYAGADRRFPWENLFFNKQFETPLIPEEAGVYKNPLELVRLAPSASNKQPWRIVKIGNAWHFYIFRNRQYPPPIFNFLLNLADLQRIDLGIAMSHFELTARELGLSGAWHYQDPGISLPNPLVKYSISWRETKKG